MASKSTKATSKKAATSEPQKLSAPLSQSTQRINFQQARVVPGFLPKTWFLIVSGIKPYLNMQVHLSPLIYTRKPEYWGIEVIGTLAGPGLTAIAPYHVFIPLAGITGTKGVEVIGASSSKKLAVPPGSGGSKGGGGGKKAR